MRYTAAKPSDSTFSHVFFNFNNCQAEVVSDVISVCVADQSFGMDVCANFGDSRLRASEAPFLDLFRTSIPSDRKCIVTLYTVSL